MPHSHPSWAWAPSSCPLFWFHCSALVSCVELSLVQSLRLTLCCLGGSVWPALAPPGLEASRLARGPEGQGPCCCRRVTGLHCSSAEGNLRPPNLRLGLLNSTWLCAGYWVHCGHRLGRACLLMCGDDSLNRIIGTLWGGHWAFSALDTLSSAII